MFSNKGTITTLALACASLSLAAFPAHAGFEWVPPQGQAPAAPPSPVAKVEAQPLTTQPSAQIHTPAGQQALPPATAPAATVSAAPQHVPNVPPPITAPTPLPETSAAMPTPARQPTPTYAPLSPMPGTAPAAVTAAPTPAPVAAAPAPIATAPVMRQSAPAQASGGKLVINPFPSDKTSVTLAHPPAATTVMPAPARVPAAPGETYGLVVGFGSDLPLPLALNQVVPADYAYSFISGVNVGARVSWDGGKPWNVVLAEMLAPLNLEAVITGKAVVIRPMGSNQLSKAETPVPVPAAAPAEEIPLAAAEIVAVEPAAGDESSAADVIDDGLRRKNIVDPGQGPEKTGMSIEQMRRLPVVSSIAAL